MRIFLLLKMRQALAKVRIGAAASALGTRQYRTGVVVEAFGYALPERLSDAELRKLATLLWRFAERDLDQFELWRFSVRAGQVFINMARQPDLGATPEAYDDINRFIDRDERPNTVNG